MRWRHKSCGYFMNSTSMCWAHCARLCIINAKSTIQIPIVVMWEMRTQEKEQKSCDSSMLPKQNKQYVEANKVFSTLPYILYAQRMIHANCQMRLVNTNHVSNGLFAIRGMCCSKYVTCVNAHAHTHFSLKWCSVQITIVRKYLPLVINSDNNWDLCT